MWRLMMSLRYCQSQPAAGYRGGGGVGGPVEAGQDVGEIVLGDAQAVVCDPYQRLPAAILGG